MRKRSSKQNRERRLRRREVGKGVLAALALALVATAAAVTRLTPFRPSPPTAEPATPSQPGLQLSKEYIYAGGKLVASEEPAPTPTPTPAGPAPTNLLATATSASSVALTWAASAGAVGYVVERRGAPGTSPVEIPTGSGSPSFNDAPPPGDFAYLYRVRAVFDSGGSSAYGGADLATTVAFTDDPLVGVGDTLGRPATRVRAQHLQELRRAIEAVRTLAGAGAAAWKPDPAPQQQGLLLAAHFLELRTNLNPALAALGIAELPADPTLGAGRRIKAAHLQDVRDKVR